MKEALSFDDVLLVPKKFDGSSRSEIDLTTSLFHGLDLPIISANMPSVTESEMFSAMGDLGGLGIVHRMCSIEEQVEMIKKGVGNSKSGSYAAAIGIGNDWLERSKRLLDVGVNVFCIDVAHGHQERVLEVVKDFRKQFSTMSLIVGNISTLEAADEIMNTGGLNTVLKIGVGGGSVCSTRIATGCGVPTLQSIMDIARHYPSIADGGIKNSGDIVKSLAAGAKAVMLGSLLAGTDEAPGEIIKGNDGSLYKIYRGAASYGAKKEFFNKAEYIEGAETLVKYKGSLSKVVKKLTEGVKSGFSYCGAHNLQELQENAEFVKITSAGMKESFPHGLL